MTMEEILKLTFPQFNARLTDIGVIHSHFNAEKGKGRTVKKTPKQIYKEIKDKGVTPPKFGLVQ